jgi:2-polyprenyl-3-methyl-5-hydroxy-6-metoxy-1,4-benzoquinol methylase
MDSPTASLSRLLKTYKAFRIINKITAYWKWVYELEIRPHLHINKTTRIADLGCGDGFVLHEIGKWAKKDGFNVHLIGIEPDQRVQVLQSDFPEIHFFCGYLHEFTDQVDILISNHVLHHLNDKEITDLLFESERVTTTLVLHNDIRRTWLALFLYPIIGIWFSLTTFAFIDGLRSIRRSFTTYELKKLIPLHWQVFSYLPFRILVKLSIK